MCLEHLAAPDQVIETVHDQLLNPGGIVIIDVPNEFNTFQVAGQHLHNLAEWWVCPPNHLNYFSHKSLQALVEDKHLTVRFLSSSFPLELFLLFGTNYVTDPKTGRRCHEQRMAFEENLRKSGNPEILHSFYQAMANLGLGRQVLLYAQKAYA